MNQNIDDLIINETNINDELKKIIRDKINSNPKKIISFKSFMDIALYHSNLGYYKNALPKFQDYVTAPIISTLFGKTIANFLKEDIEEAKDIKILELGAGNGKLALDIIRKLQDYGVTANYHILEISNKLISEQKALLKDFNSQISWVEDIPDTFDGYIIANELLDAIPCHRFCYSKETQSIHELGVTIENNNFYSKPMPDPSEEFKAFLKSSYYQKIFNLIQSYDIDYVSEVNLAALGMFSKIISSLNNGKCLIIDYGYQSTSELYSKERHLGSLISFKKHKTSHNPYENIGSQDLTSFIDFEELSNISDKLGANIEYFSNQEIFLLEHGILTEKISQPQQFNHEVRLLTSPEEMGNIVKVLLCSK